MYRILATLIKEFQMLIRDKTGMTLLFAMPIFLVFTMTLLQHEAYRSLNETGVPVLLVNLDQDTLGLSIEKGFENFPLCDLTVDHGDIYVEKSKITESVMNGQFVVAVLIPKGASQVLRDDVQKIMDALMEDKALGEEQLKQVEIEIIVDPIARKSFVMAISSGLREFIAAIKTQVIFRMMSDNMQELIGGENKVKFPSKDFFIFEEKYAMNSADEGIYQPNAVQHNVPAWAIFSIFFIVIPLAGSIINERSIGLYTRLRTFPGSYLSILSGKLLLYFLIAMIQMMIIILIGKFGLPHLGLPELTMSGSKWAFVMLTAAVSMTAIGYGLLLGTLFEAAPQASIFGGISILILSALGGIWVPINVMPTAMQKISAFSPLNWGLSGYYELFIKGGDWPEIQGYVLRLMVFFILLLVVSYWVYGWKRRLV